MPYSFLPPEKVGEQDEVSFLGFVLSKSKGTKLAPCTGKGSTAAWILHGEQVLPAAGRWQCSTWQKLLLGLMSFWSTPFVSGSLVQLPGGCRFWFASRISCYLSRINSEVKLMLVHFLIAIFLWWGYESSWVSINGFFSRIIWGIWECLEELLVSFFIIGAVWHGSTCICWVSE